MAKAQAKAAGKPAAKAAKGGKKKSFKKKEKRVVHSGLVHIQATFNNTIVTISDLEGNTIAWSSAGSLGFRGSRKGTPFAAQQAAMTAANKATETGLRTVDVRVSGPGSGRESAVRALSTAGIEVRVIRDATPMPHNGCPPKKRRVQNWVRSLVFEGTTGTATVRERQTAPEKGCGEVGKRDEGQPTAVNRT